MVPLRGNNFDFDGIKCLPHSLGAVGDAPQAFPVQVSYRIPSPSGSCSCSGLLSSYRTPLLTPPDRAESVFQEEDHRVPVPEFPFPIPEQLELLTELCCLNRSLSLTHQTNRRSS